MWREWSKVVVLLFILISVPGQSRAQNSEATSSASAAVAKIDTGDTAWVLLSSAMVLAMLVPGLALFYGGLVRSKNVLGTIMQSFLILSLVSVIWILFGYSLAFGPDVRGVIGDLEWIGLRGVGFAPHPTYGPTIPHQAFMIFQLMFAAIMHHRCVNPLVISMSPTRQLSGPDC